MMPSSFYTIFITAYGSTAFYGKPYTQEADATFHFSQAHRRHDDAQVLFSEPGGVCTDVTDDFLREFKEDPANAEFLRDQAEWEAS